MQEQQDLVESFLAISAVLTGYDRVDLLGTGLADEYYRQVVAVVGEKISRELWAIGTKIIHEYGGDEAGLEAAIRREVLASTKFGPVARNIIQLWYWGSWLELPQAWRSRYGTSPADVTHFTSAEAYKQGLIWDAMGTHPQGAKQPGFGSWSLLPHSEERDSAGTPGERSSHGR